MSRDIPVDPNLEKQYNVRLLRDDFEAVSNDWVSRSADLRETSDASLDCAYGSGERDRLDVFRCGKKDAPLYIFIHGGYWQRGDKSIYSFVAEPFLACGADVALIGYPLCPDVNLAQLVARLRLAVSWLWKHSADLGISKDRFNMSGHSAGGHVTAMLLATDWQVLDPELPGDLLKSGIPLSGLYQLEPLRKTTIADALGLNNQMTEECSPHFLKPATQAPVLVTLGGAETSQFHWQAEEFSKAWTSAGIDVTHHAEPDVDHFDILNRLADPSSALFQKTYAWLR